MPLADQLFTGLGLAGFTDLCVFKEWQGLQNPGVGAGRMGADFVPLDRGLTLSKATGLPSPGLLPLMALLTVFKGHWGKESGSQLEKVTL